MQVENKFCSQIVCNYVYQVIIKTVPQIGSLKIQHAHGSPEVLVCAVPTLLNTDLSKTLLKVMTC